MVVKGRGIVYIRFGVAGSAIILKWRIKRPGCD
jgi:hypothetical protein